MASKPIRWSVAIVSIALIFSLALTTIIGNVSTLQSIYSEIINQQEEQTALAFVSQKTTQNSAKVTDTLPPQESNRVIVKYKEKDLPPGISIAAERANLEKAQGLKHILTISGINAQVYEVSENDTASEVVNRILSTKKDLIEYAEVDMLAVPAYIPNDPYYTNASSWHLGKISAATAWDTSKGDGVTVAILDSGVDCTHAELSAHCVPGWNAASNNTDSTDINGHGTLVASTLGSVGDNAQGGVGVTFNSKIMPIRLTNDPANQGVPCSYIASGITYAADHGAKVASNSYEIFGCTVVTDAANYMATKGGVYVRAAGNSGAQITTTNDENVIIASATDGNDVKTSWSNYGSIVDVSAPGINVYCSSKTGSYGTCWGTSFSVPIVSSVLALIYSTNPNLTPAQAKSILFSTADDLGTAGWDQYYGHGRVNAAKAVAAAL
ncbi:MAG: S8 family serine peptidase, partial [Candidatus Saccharibacteria bacterium]|nr:S8 family serine peptidase [Candidatus Saccharibacteria bacterium]